MACFTDALSDLTAECRDRICSRLHAWTDDVDLKQVQVATNIQQETALTMADFSSLLQTFAAQLAVAVEPGPAWEIACRAHQLRGAIVPDTHRPSVLGRALAVDSFAANMQAVPRSNLTRLQARQLLNKYAGQIPTPDMVAKIRSAWLGRHLIWATFHEADSTQDPFETLPPTSQDIRTVLGLGHLEFGETLILLAYPSHAAGATLVLRRPTIADAETSPYFRPHSEPQHPYGYTQPLSPNPSALGRQPEVVHEPITAIGVIFPYRIAL